VALTLEAFLTEEMQKLGIDGFLAARPLVKAEVDQHLSRGASPSAVHRWLVQEHQYPFAKDGVIRYARKLTTAKAA
jgi:hypothetical protein